MRITVVCGNGLGSSLMMEMSIKNIIKEMGITAQVGHTDLASVKGAFSDIFVATRDIALLLEDQIMEGKVVALNSAVDKKEMEERLSQAFSELAVR